MRFYVASVFSSYENTRRVCEELRKAGHEITHDWTSSHQFVGGHPVLKAEDMTQDERNFVAIDDAAGVMNADALILYPTKNIYGALIEVGIAIGCSKEVWIIGEPERESVFFDLENFKRFDNLEEAIIYAGMR